MAKGAAKESQLARLHTVLATVLTEQVGERVQEEDEETGEMREFYTAQPALLTCAMKFLKDNEITCEPEENQALSGLREQLEKRRKGHGKVIEMSPIGDEHDYVSM